MNDVIAFPAVGNRIGESVVLKHDTHFGCTLFHKVTKVTLSVLHVRM